ncbi:hypothetical protein QUF63_00465 [Anaerolineales bacterium HSG25]|nr:hypothetical protein [Anaerolineales bacterium HSG25]
MIDYVTMFKLDNQFILNETYLATSKRQAERVIALLDNDLWPVKYGSTVQFSFLDEADRANFQATVQWALAVVLAEKAGRLQDYATLYELVTQRLNRHACLRHYHAFVSENDFCRDDVAHLRWVIETPLPELILWLSAAKGRSYWA